MYTPYTRCMAGWLHAVDSRGLLVTPAFVERLKKRQTAAVLNPPRMRMLRSEVDSSRERASGAREPRLVDPGADVAVTRTSVGNRS